MKRILITPRSLSLAPPPELDPLRQAGFDLVFPEPGRMPDEAALLALLPGCVGWLAGVEPVSDRVIAAADSLRAISRNGTGVDNLPLPLLAERGIRVLRAEGANAVGVAELTVGLMLAALRHIPDEVAGTRAGRWPRSRGKEISGRSIGIVGCGAIGRRVARAVSAMGAEIVAHDPFRPDVEVYGPFRWAGLDELFAEADVVTLHCPPPPDGRPVVDAARLAMMRPGAILINTARAALVDEAAVRAALDAGRLQAYATDVFVDEPPGEGSLAGHPRVIATSHIGGLTDESVAKATSIAVANLLAALEEEAAP
ncbi:MAG: phosphoglycerate dehydrogenase [Rhodobacteraceae bacterium]|jgi:D-3-phosphoglycerate dehydrogenase|nr:phosphoglycerate dehydrogenase [Paracoccaceae bacterium]